MKLGRRCEIREEPEGIRIVLRDQCLLEDLDGPRHGADLVSLVGGRDVHRRIAIRKPRAMSLE